MCCYVGAHCTSSDYKIISGYFLCFELYLHQWLTIQMAFQWNGRCFSGIRGGPLKTAYTLDQFHGHWGETDDCGSEHTLDGRPFAGEIHFVHWNRKYGTMDKACEHRDGFAVVGVFLEVNWRSRLQKERQVWHGRTSEENLSPFHRRLENRMPSWPS